MDNKLDCRMEFMLMGSTLSCHICRHLPLFPISRKLSLLHTYLWPQVWVYLPRRCNSSQLESYSSTLSRRLPCSSLFALDEENALSEDAEEAEERWKLNIDVSLPIG